MGVNTFLLDRRTVTLLVGGSRQTVGTLRQFFKLTELDDERAAELEAAALITPSPVAALVLDITDLPLASTPDNPASCRRGAPRLTDTLWRDRNPCHLLIECPHRHLANQETGGSRIN